MSTTEQDRVHQFLSDEEAGNHTGRRFIWDPYLKTLRVTGPWDPDDMGLEVTPSDMEHSREPL